MASNSKNTCGGAFENARWPEANVTAFIKIIYNEVMLGNIMIPPFPRSKWTDIMSKMLRACPGYKYSVKQLKGKFARIKAKWKKYNTLLKSDTGFGWDDANDTVTGSDDCWARWLAANPNDSNLRRKRCPHYMELTTIFAPNDEGFGETAPSSASYDVETESSSSYDSDTSGEAVYTAILSALHSWQRATEMVSSYAKTMFERCVPKLKEILDLPPDVYYTACKKLENNPVRCRTFLAMKPELRRGYIESLLL